MHTNNEQHYRQFYARMAGLSYVVFTLAGMIKSFLLNTSLSDSNAIQIHGLFANEMQFRLGVAAEIIMFLGVIMASVSFYLVLKSVNKPLAQTALCLRLVEIIIGGIAVVISMAMLAISASPYMMEMFSTEQLHSILAIAARFRTPAYEYSWISMGIAGVITFYLFYKTRLIPRAWSLWGILTYSSLIAYPMAKLLISDLPREAMFVLFPGALFELGVGLWLLIKGISIPKDTAEIPAKTVAA